MALVQSISHSSPVPFYIAALSSQSRSILSKSLSLTKLAKSVHVFTGSLPYVVGNSVAPKADIIILIFPLL